MRPLTAGRRMRQHAVCVTLVLLIAPQIGLLSASRSLASVAHAAASTEPGGSVPAGLPSHFSFGLMDAPAPAPGGTSYLDSMRQQNGTAWDYRYQYLAGGVNTGSGWRTWNSPAGAFARYYIQDSQAHGYRPAFVYYNLLQSQGPGGANEAATDLAHLADPATMHAYYADWMLLMQQISASAGGQPVLVIVEPDLWGYIEQAAGWVGTNSATSVPASVASSGNAELAGLPNTAQGFALALLVLRAHYAPNAVLALHASPWGSGTDIASDAHVGLSVAASVGRADAAFLATAGLAGTPGLPAGVAPFDLLSADLADRDSAQSGVWWDPTNTTFPNFARYLSYASALSAAAGVRLVLWQVPVGNQVYQTEDNRPGHTQDNKATYILSHIADFAAAGIVGVLFGPGNGGTNATDSRRDGITNSAPISTHGCDRCNTQVSVYADDDGGYLRLQLGQYYTHGPYPLPGGKAPPAATPGHRATTTATSIPAASGSSHARATDSGGRSASVALPWLLAGAGLLALAGSGVGAVWLRRRSGVDERVGSAEQTGADERQWPKVPR